MGYETSGGWGAAMAMPDKDVTVFVGDGSWMMLNSDVYSSVIHGHKMIVIVCDNGGFAVINRLQTGMGGEPYNNLIKDNPTVVNPDPVDFAKHAEAMGAISETVSSIDELEAAYERAKAADRTSVIAMVVDAYSWTEGGSFWEVGVPEVSELDSVVEARAEIDEGKKGQKQVWPHSPSPTATTASLVLSPSAPRRGAWRMVSGFRPTSTRSDFRS